MRSRFAHQRARGPRRSRLPAPSALELEQLERAADAAELPAYAPRNGAFGRARDLAQPQVEHLRRPGCSHERLAVVADGRRRSSALPLEPDRHRPALRFGIGRHVDERLLVRGHARVDRRRRRPSPPECRRSAAAPASRPRPPAMSPTTTTAMLIGAVPLLVEVDAAARAGTLFRISGSADRQPLGVARALEDAPAAACR